MSRGEAPQGITAVVVLDNYAPLLAPGSQRQPPCLFPICNTTLLEYTLEFLVSNSCSEIILFSCLLGHDDAAMEKAYTDSINRYLRSEVNAFGKSWLTTTEPKVTVVGGTGCRNLAAVFMHLRDGNHVRQSDFVLIPGDLITNMTNLQSLWDEHMKRRKERPNTAVTMLAVEEPKSLFDAHMQSVAHALDKYHSIPTSTPMTPHGSSTGFPPNPYEVVEFPKPMGTSAPMMPRVSVVYDSNYRLHAATWYNDSTQEMKRTPFDLKCFKSMDPLTGASSTVDLSLRTDLVYPGVFFCATEACMSVFADKFDFTDMTQFVDATLDKEDETNLHSVSIVVSSGSFVRKVNDLQSYLYLNEAVAARKLFPLTRDANFTSHTTPYQVMPLTQSVYLHIAAGPILGTLGSNTVVGEGSHVSKNARVHRSVLGNYVKIGEGAVVENCVLWNGVVVEPHAVLQDSVVCSNTLIGTHALLKGKAFLDMNVAIAPHCTVNEGVRVSAEGHDPTVVGKEGRGSLKTIKVQSKQLANLQPLFTNDVAATVDDAQEEPAGSVETFDAALRRFVEHSIHINAKAGDFFTELNMLRTRHKGAGATIPDATVAKLLVQSAVEVIDSHAGGKAKEVLRAFVKVIENWGEMFAKIVPTPKEELAVLSGLTEGLENGYLIKGSKYCPKVLSVLFEQGIVSVESILQADDNQETYGIVPDIWACFDEYIEQLRDVEEEEEDEEDCVLL